jgi:predicted  nucleic acid-binding Zn-ribbon protein
MRSSIEIVKLDHAVDCGREWPMNTSSDAVKGAETATERLQLELDRLRSELDRCTTRLHLTEKLLEQVTDAVFVADLDGRIST